jgi:hypothetical protein
MDSNMTVLPEFIYWEVPPVTATRWATVATTTHGSSSLEIIVDSSSPLDWKTETAASSTEHTHSLSPAANPDS